MLVFNAGYAEQIVGRERRGRVSQVVWRGEGCFDSRRRVNSTVRRLANSAMNALNQLQQWYQDQCNDDWEHHFGISIETLDNPGWTVKIDLNQTELENRKFETVENLQPDDDWIKCWVENGQFHGVGGPQKLKDILETFLRWAS